MIRPRRNLLLVRPLSKDEMAEEMGHIVLPQQAQDRQRYRQFTIVAVGPEVGDPALLPGARVIITMHAGVPVTIEREPYLMVSEDHVITLLLDED